MPNFPFTYLDFKFLRFLRKEHIVFLVENLDEYHRLILPHIGAKQMSWAYWTEKNIPELWKKDTIIICPRYRFKKDVAQNFPDHYEVEV